MLIVYHRHPYLPLAPAHGLPPHPYPQHPLPQPQPLSPLAVPRPPLSSLVTKTQGKRFNDGKYVHDPAGKTRDLERTYKLPLTADLTL